MRVAFVSIPRFVCAVEALRQPRLAGASFIVGDAEQPKRVLESSATAGRRGVQPGMPIRQALGLCPEAAVLPPDPVRYQDIWQCVLTALEDLFPEMEDEAPGRAYANAAGLQHHYRDEAALAAHVIETVQEACGLVASLGIAGGKFPALAAASTAAPGEARVLAPGAEASFLASLPIDLLPIEDAVVARLDMLGLEEIGDIAGLTVPELQSQFGFEGKRLWQLANGLDEERLRPRRHAEALQATATLEAPVAGIDVMIAIVRQLLSRLRLGLNGRAARELTLQAELESGRGWQHHLVFREPVSEDERLSFLLRSALTNYPPPQAVRSLSLRLTSLTGETGKQLALGQRGRQQRRLEEAIRQLKTRYGHSPVYRCVDVEPWSVIPEERQILVESDA